MANSRSANRTGRTLVVELLAMIGIGVALAALGPFGSYGLGSFARRLAYWVPLALLGLLLFRPTLAAARALAARLDLPDWLALLVGIFAAAAPLSLVVLWWNGHGLAELPGFERWFTLYLNVALIGAMVTLIFYGIERLQPPAAHPAAASSAGPAPAEDGTPPAPFLARLPPGWDGELAALEMEDHYVRAHRPGASALILMRMRDAEAELGAVDGMRVHRSWWVARSAVEGVARDGRRLRLRLRGGIEAPVARDRVAALKAAGWL